MVVFSLLVIISAFVGFAVAIRRARHAFGVSRDDWAHPASWFSSNRRGGGVMFLSEPQTSAQARAQAQLRFAFAGWIGAIVLVALALRGGDAWAATLGQAQLVGGLLAGLSLILGFAYVQHLASEGEPRPAYFISAVALGASVVALALIF